MFASAAAAAAARITERALINELHNITHQQYMTHARTQTVIQHDHRVHGATFLEELVVRRIR